MIQWQIIGALLILLKQKGGWEREGGGRLRNYTGGDQHIYHCRRANLKLDGKSQSLARARLQGRMTRASCVLEVLHNNSVPDVTGTS